MSWYGLNTVGSCLTLAFTHQVGIVGMSESSYIAGMLRNLCWHPQGQRSVLFFSLFLSFLFLVCFTTLRSLRAFSKVRWKKEGRRRGAAALPAILCVDPIKLQGRHGGSAALPANSHADPKVAHEKSGMEGLRLCLRTPTPTMLLNPKP